ncbi:MAG: anthrone oxygenase family protein, partial [Pseudomonadota bacterium]
SGLMAGTYLAFSSFIMRALSSLGDQAAAAAMNAINRVILRSAFMPVFFGSTLIAVLLMLHGLFNSHAAEARIGLLAGGVYLLGMFAVTAAANVPLNNALAEAADPQPGAGISWPAYRSRWTRWNTVRSLASLAALGLSLRALNL